MGNTMAGIPSGTITETYEVLPSLLIPTTFDCIPAISTTKVSSKFCAVRTILSPGVRTFLDMAAISGVKTPILQISLT